MNTQSPVTDLKGVGAKTAKLMEKLDIRTVGDLLAHYPRDYETFQEPVPVAEAVTGEVCAIYVAVAGIPNLKKVRNLSILNVTVRDASGAMQLTFFNMPFLKCIEAGGLLSVQRSGSEQGNSQNHGAAQALFL